MLRLQDRVAIVTGSARNIGFAIARRFASEGAKVVVADLNVEGAQAAANELRTIGPGALAVKCDVSNRADVENMVAAALHEFGQIDILVNNAGITRDASLEKMTDEQWDQVINVHLKGAFYCARAVAKHMKERRWGRIINISSTAGRVGNFGQTNYSAAKAGLCGMAMTWAKELARYNITANAIQPGFIDTDMTRAIPEPYRSQKIAEIPLGRAGSIDDIAAAAAFLASDDGAFVTGHALLVAGGRTM